MDAENKNEMKIELIGRENGCVEERTFRLAFHPWHADEGGCVGRAAVSMYECSIAIHRKENRKPTSETILAARQSN